MLSSLQLTRPIFDKAFRQLAIEYKRLAGRKAKADIVLVGGAAIIFNYSFRSSSIDADGVFSIADSCLKQAISSVSDKLNLPTDWLNDDFKVISSFSSRIPAYSAFFKNYLNVLDIRYINREYLLATKLMAFRDYGHDQSDILGILIEENERGNPLTKEQIDKAMKDLYGGWSKCLTEAQAFIEYALQIKDLCSLSEQTKRKEAFNKEALLKEQACGTSLLGKSTSQVLNQKVDKKKY